VRKKRISFPRSRLIKNKFKCWQISKGGEVPQSYYLDIVKPTPKKNMTSISVASGSKKKLEYKIIQSNSVLRYLNNENNQTFWFFTLAF
jgi:hypothetical protein